VAAITNEDSLDRSIELLKEAFPELRCLRCGNDRFFIQEDSLRGQEAPDALHGIVTLTCTRCGFLERHDLDMLTAAEKPLKKLGDG
jgi:predicted nucleic-acid-binding Zn-ribbon protein